MTARVDLVLRAFQGGFLGGVSLLVPACQRAEWRREWQAELWHVRRACTPEGPVSWQAEREVTAFCLGAFKDALCLRHHAPKTGMRIALLHGSALQCLLFLAGVVAASYGLALLLPGVRVESHPERYQVRPGVIMIQDQAYSDDGVAATIPVERFRDWKTTRQRYFDDLAFYRIGEQPVSAGSHGTSGWEVAEASANLFSLLGLPLRFVSQEGEADTGLPQAILSDEVWKREFGGDPRIVGSVVRVGQREARVAGVAAEGAWRLPGKADAWLLEQDSEIASGGRGHVVAHLTGLGRSEMWASYVHIDSDSSDAAEDNLCGFSFDQRTRGPWGIYQFTVLLAFLALPAITTVSMGEYSVSLHRPSWSIRLCRWGYMGAKIALLLPIVYFLSLDLSYWHTTLYSSASEYAQLAFSFSICLFGLRWALLDQRQRCPVCLRHVTNPARVGLASRTFLAWNGTELMCTSGHTLLHVPELATSWFSTQRWLYLDTSWEFLFTGSGVG
jgi:hypothetical protein